MCFIVRNIENRFARGAAHLWLDYIMIVLHSYFLEVLKTALFMEIKA